MATWRGQGSQAEASLVLRRYLEGQFDMRAAEKTTDEVVAMPVHPGSLRAAADSPGPGPSGHGQVWREPPDLTHLAP